MSANEKNKHSVALPNVHLRLRRDAGGRTDVQLDVLECEIGDRDRRDCPQRYVHKHIHEINQHIENQLCWQQQRVIGLERPISLWGKGLHLWCHKLPLK